MEVLEHEKPSRADMLGGYMSNCMQASQLLNETLRRLVALGANRPELQAYAANTNLFMQTSLMWLDNLARALEQIITQEDGNGEGVSDK